jgi:hypothetical protein
VKGILLYMALVVMALIWWIGFYHVVVGIGKFFGL